MDKSKSKIILLDTSGFETVAKVLSAGDWTLNESGGIELTAAITNQFLFSSSQNVGGAPRLSLAKGNTKPLITQVSCRGGSANVVNPPPEPKVQAATTSSSSHERDGSFTSTLNVLGKKLLVAARIGDTQEVRRLMAIGAPFVADGPIGMTPLHLSAQNGHYETSYRLLCAGMNKDSKNKIEKTPLHLAAMEGHSNIALLLIKGGANVNACDMLKMTALHWSCDRGHIAIVRILLKHGALIGIYNKFNKSPVQLAIENGHQEIVKLLQLGMDFIDDESTVIGDSLLLGVSDNILSVPTACKTEEVHTEVHIGEVIEENGQEDESGDELISSIENELPHSIMADDSDEMTSETALELLRAQEDLISLDDSSSLISSAIAHGQTIHLTEAGKRALNMMKLETQILPPLLPRQNHTETNINHMNKYKQFYNKKSKPVTTSSSNWIAVSTPKPHSIKVHKELPCHEESLNDKKNEERITQVITLSPTQYATLTGGKNGPVILQVMPSGDHFLISTNTMDQDNLIQEGQTFKRQKVMELVTPKCQNQSQVMDNVAREILDVELRHEPL